jgi:methionyl-tRNA formyltransferase
VRILFAGTPEVSATILEWLVKSGHEIACVLTRTDSYVGRKRVLTPSATAIKAEELGLPIVKANRVDDETLSQIASFNIDLAIVVAYGSILNQRALASIPNGWFNIHFSLLPKYRGAAPVQRALLNGDKETGVTIFQLDAGMDTGPVLTSLSTSIGFNESSGDLLARLAELSKSLLSEALPQLYSGTFNLHEQSGDSSSAPKPNREEARLDFNRPASTLENIVRGMNPEPMAWCMVGDEVLRVLSAVENRSAALVSGGSGASPGSLLWVEGKVFAVCGQDSILELLEVQPSSKRAMPARDWFNGNRSLERLN